MSIIWSWIQKWSNVTQKHLREKGTHNQQKVLYIEIPNGCTVRKTYQASSSLCCFAACWARHCLSLLAKMGTSLMSPTECQNWKLPHQSYAKGPKSQRSSVFHWMHVHTHSLVFLFFVVFFFLYFDWHFPQLWGCFFLSLYAKWLHLRAQNSWILL